MSARRDQSNKKRKCRTSESKAQPSKEDEEQTGYMRIVGEGLRKVMGGVKLCREEDLTMAVLLEFLKSQG